jgi:predicted choloylglycine hydrolase
MEIIIEIEDYRVYKEITILNHIRYELKYTEYLELYNNSIFINFLIDRNLFIRPVNYIKFKFYY